VNKRLLHQFTVIEQNLLPHLCLPVRLNVQEVMPCLVTGSISPRSIASGLIGAEKLRIGCRIEPRGSTS